MLKYIKGCDKTEHFFSQYGNFNHTIHQLYYSGELQTSDLADYYCIHFAEKITAKAPNLKLRENYFKSGLAYWRLFNGNRNAVCGVEKEVTFNICGKPFVGFVDLIENIPHLYVRGGCGNQSAVRFDDVEYELIITDHKSRDLKPRSSAGKYTLGDAELDNYLKQLYLYSIPISKEFGKMPDKLKFNCFRTGTEITEIFLQDKFEEAKKWASELIVTIENNEDWKPNIEYFKCKHICDMCDSCEYYEMFAK